jgi:hypothetical protein
MFCFSVRITHARNCGQHSLASQIPRWNNSSTRKWTCFGKGSRAGRTNVDRYCLACFRRSLVPYRCFPYPFCARRVDPGHLFGKETQKVVVPGVCWRRRRAMGTMVSCTSRSSFDLDSSMSPASLAQQDRQRRTETAEIRSRYTFTYHFHFIRAYSSFYARTLSYGARLLHLRDIQIATNSAPPSLPPSPKPSRSCSPILRLNRVVQLFRSLPMPPASHRFPFGSRSKWMGSRPGEGCR